MHPLLEVTKALFSILPGDSLGLGGVLRQGLADPRRGLDENDDRPNRRSAQAPEEGWNCALAPFCSGEILDAKRSRQISQML